MSHDHTCTLQVAAMTPSTGVSENGSNIRSDRRMKSGFSRYLDTHMHRNVKRSVLGRGAGFGGVSAAEAPWWV